MKSRRHRNDSIPEHPGFHHYVEKLETEKMPPLLQPRRVADLLDMNVRRIYELVEVGELAAVRVGARGMRILRDSLTDWLRRGGSGNLHQQK